MLFSDKFNEHVWENFFMVSQAFYISQTCSLNKSGNIFDTMGVPGGVTFPRHVHKKHETKFIPRFFSNGCGVGDGVSRRLEFQYNPLSR